MRILNKIGGDNGTRTHDNGFADRGLNQLGYVTMIGKYNINLTKIRIEKNDLL